MKIRYLYKALLTCFFQALLVSCKQAYLPPQTASNPNYLVVEGIINTGNDSTMILLSRTVALTSTSTSSPEKGAIVAVESDAGSTYPLKEIVAGTYASIPLNLDQTRMYRLRITTSAGRVYLSDFVPSKISPPIDSISYTTTNNNLVLYSNTHNLAGTSRYYRWDYVETWEFSSPILTSLKVNAARDSLIQRDPNNPADQVRFCWKTIPSTTINLASSAAISQDIIQQNPILTIPSTDVRLTYGYSMLLKQYVLTSDAFTFWQELSKNTQNTGSIFDAQPSQLISNIHGVTNPGDIVIGYISAGTVTQLRITLYNSQLPQYWQFDSPSKDIIEENCPIYTFFYPTVPPGPPTYQPFSELLPVNSIYLAGYQIQPDVYTGGVARCVDCTLSGSSTKPSYWK